MSGSNSKSLEELLELLNTSDSLGDHRDEFLKDIEAISDDSVNTPTTIIYWVYLKWCLINKQKEIPRRDFFSGFKVKFKQHRYNVQRTYCIKSKHFELTEDEKELMWQHLKSEKEKERFQKRLQDVRKAKRKLNRKRKLENGTQ